MPTHRKETSSSTSHPVGRVESELTKLENLVQSAERDESNKLTLNTKLASTLVSARLGIATGLFEAIRMKHPPTALHFLGVALGCSVWHDKISPGNDRNELEIAVLLHDVGKIGVPDEILEKPFLLDVNEQELIDSQRKKGLEVIRTICKSVNLVNCVHYASTWYDGSHNGLDRIRDQLPMASRMLAMAGRL